MSKRYVIQVLDTVTDENAKNVYDVETSEQDQPMTAWFSLQHPAGGDWKTRSRSTAIADAAKLVHGGETRELRIAVSRPVYEVTPEVDFEAIKNAAEVIASNAWVDDDDDDDDIAPLDIVELENDVAPVVFEVVDEPKPKTAKYENPDGSVAEFEI